MSHSMHVHGHSHRADSGYANYQASNRPQQLDPIRSENNGDKRRGGGIEHMDGNQGAGRRNPLVNAMMQALQGLMAGAGGSTNVQGAATVQAANDSLAVAPVADAAADQAVTTTSAASSAESTSSKGELKDAAAAFAHELFNALRDGAGDDDVKRKGNGHGHEFGHHHGHGHGRGHGGDRVGGAYSNLAQKLQDLAGKIETTQPVAPAVPIAAAATIEAAAAETAMPTALPDTAAEVIDASAAATPPAELATPAAAGLNINVNININVQFSGSVLQPVSAEQPTAASPLLAAFEKLMEKLQPASDQSSAVSTADKLRQFLLGMASSLQSGSTAADGDSVRPSTGSLINIAA